MQNYKENLLKFINDLNSIYKATEIACYGENEPAVINVIELLEQMIDDYLLDLKEVLSADEKLSYSSANGVTYYGQKIKIEKINA